MKILGISDHFTSGAAVIIDGEVVAVVNEERLARKNMVMGFPRKSITEVLRLSGVNPRALDHVAVASEWGHFLNDYVDFSNGVFGVNDGVVRNLFFSAGVPSERRVAQSLFSEETSAAAPGRFTWTGRPFRDW